MPEIVTSVHIYPVKSMAAATVNGEVPTQLDVGPTGFTAQGVADRQWMLDYEGSFVSQRGWAKGTQKTQFKSDAMLATAQVDIRSDHTLVTVQGQRGGSLEIAHAVPDAEPRTSLVHGAEVTVLDEGDEAAAFFTRAIGREVRLRRADKTNPRQIGRLYQRKGAGNTVAAADGMPFLLTNSTSLAALHNKAGIAPGTVSMDRYRPNIVVETDEPFLEDTWRQIRAGSFLAYVVKPCKRCPIPNIDQATGSVDNASNKILGARSGDIAVRDAPSSRGLYFGQNLNHRWPAKYRMSVQAGTELVILDASTEPNVRLRSAQ